MLVCIKNVWYLEHQPYVIDDMIIIMSDKKKKRSLSMGIERKTQNLQDQPTELARNATSVCIDKAVENQLKITSALLRHIVSPDCTANHSGVSFTH